MEARDFVEVAAVRMGDLFDALLEDPDLMHGVAHLLSSPAQPGIQARGACACVRAVCVPRVSRASEGAPLALRSGAL